MKILLLGTGYLGLSLLGQWPEESDRFIATTTTPEKISEITRYKCVEKAVVVKGNETSRLRALLSECDGAIVCVAPSKGFNYNDTYLETARSMQEALKGRKTPFYLLYTGSTSVYGDHQGAMVNEAAERHLRSEEARILAETEDCYLSCVNKFVTTCILRLGGIYGPNRTMESRVRKFSGTELPGKGDSPTNNIHLKDIVRAIPFCLKKRCEGVFNLVNDDHRTRKDLYKDLCKTLKIEPPKWQPKLTPIHGSNCVVSNQKIKDQGFAFLYPTVGL